MTASRLAERRTLGDRALDWWAEYCHPRDGDPATRARLRRCRSATEALGVAAAVDLARRLGAFRTAATPDDRYVERALNLARVLAHVRSNTTEQPMRQAGWKSFPGNRRDADAAASERPRLSEIRFRRLLAASRGEELVAAFTRLVALLDGTANVAALANDFMWWGERTKRRWAFDYYAAGIATPPEPTTLEDVEE